MPFTTTQVKGDTLRTKKTTFYQIDSGVLRNLSAINLNEDSEHMDNYVRFGIAKDVEGVNQIISVLGNGYCDGMTNVNWTGNIPLEPNMFIFIDVWSSDSSTINLGIVTEV